MLPERAVLVPGTATLVLGDVHLGKGALHRQAGVPLPDPARSELAVIAELAQQVAARHVVIAGDLVHGIPAVGDELVHRIGHWVESVPFDVTLVAGNHDRRLVAQLGAAGLCVIRGSFDAGGVRVIHEPDDEPVPTISAHEHPVVVLRAGRDRLRLRCFAVDGTSLRLPAFGDLTGGREVERRPGTRIAAIIGSGVSWMQA